MENYRIKEIINNLSKMDPEFYESITLRILFTEDIVILKNHFPKYTFDPVYGRSLYGPEYYIITNGIKKLRYIVDDKKSKKIRNVDIPLFK